MNKEQRQDLLEFLNGIKYIFQIVNVNDEETCPIETVYNGEK